MAKVEHDTWEMITSSYTERHGGTTTARLAVPGGWLYRVIHDQYSIAMVFVPLPSNQDWHGHHTLLG